MNHDYEEGERAERLLHEKATSAPCGAASIASEGRVGHRRRSARSGSADQPGIDESRPRD